MRRLDIEEVLGDIEFPDIDGGTYLAEILWAVGPVRTERAIDEIDLQAWESRRGIELDPWEADIIISMSRAYLTEQYSAREWNAAPCWAPAAKMWKYVRDELYAPKLRQAMEQNQVKEANGNRKRR